MKRVVVDRELLAKHIGEIDAWNSSMSKILGDIPYVWQSLEDLRAILNGPEVCSPHGKHTSGPWQYWENGDVCGVGKDHGNQSDLFSVRPDADTKRPFSENLANMLLASLAPDMFEVLHSISTAKEGHQSDLVHLPKATMLRIKLILDAVQSGPCYEEDSQDE